MATSTKYKISDDREDWSVIIIIICLRPDAWSGTYWLLHSCTQWLFTYIYNHCCHPTQWLFTYIYGHCSHSTQWFFTYIYSHCSQTTQWLLFRCITFWPAFTKADIQFRTPTSLPSRRLVKNGIMSLQLSSILVGVICVNWMDTTTAKPGMVQ